MFHKISAYINRSIGRRLLCLFLLMALVPIIFYTVSIVINTGIAGNLVRDSVEDIVNVSLARLESLFQNARTVSESLQSSAYMQKQMRTRYATQRELFSAELETDMELAGILNGHDDLSGAYLLGINDLCSKSNGESFLYSDYSTESWYRRALNSESGIWVGLHEQSLVARTANRSFISYCVPFIDRATGRPNGVIVIEISSSILSELLAYDATATSYILLENNGDTIFATDHSCFTDDALSAICRAGIAAVSTVDDEVAALNVQHNAVVCRRSEETGWVLIGAVAASYLSLGTRSMILVAALCTILVLLLAAIITSRGTRMIVTPIRSVTKAMAMVEEGDMSVHLDVSGEDETAQLAHGFNHMVRHINTLLKSVYQQQRMLRKTEFKALQSQINPHFLYNSLDSISWLIKMRQLDDALLILQNLSTLFRIALSKGHELIPVRSELAHLQSYIAIQSIRYSKKFSFELYEDEDALDYVTLKLMLQPLVENCIYHGLSAEKPSINIVVSVDQTDADIIFVVRDDGVGMNEAQLNRLRESISYLPGTDDVATQADTSGGGYGLANINGRIRVYFGKEYGMTIDSAEGEGTTITIRIPKLKEDEI